MITREDKVTLSEEELRDAGLKVTVPRTRVLEVLTNADPHHLSAEDVYKKLLLDGKSMISMATVYRVLTQFEAAGIVERRNFADGHAVFELTPTTHHDHMVDVDTGQVVEFLDEKIEKLQEMIAKKHGYELVDHELVLYVRKKPKS